MAFTSPHMGLRIWNLLSDLYDHAQLADNWAKVEYHDHSFGRGVQVPTDGLVDRAVTSAKLAESLDPSGAYTTYRHYFGGTATGQWTTANNPLLLTRLGAYSLAGANSGLAVFYIDPTDHAVAGRVGKMRITSTMITNAVPPTNTLTVGLNKVLTFGGTSGNAATVATVDTIIPGSGVSFVSQPASTPMYAKSGDFDIPEAGWYVLGFSVDVNAAANSTETVHATLQVRYV